MDLKIWTGVVIISLFIFSVTSYIAGLEGKYGHTADMTQFDNTQHHLGKMYNESQAGYGLFEDQVTSETKIDFNAVIRLPLRIVKTLLYGFQLIMWEIPKDSYGALKTSLGLEDESGYILDAIITIITLPLIIFLISLLLRWKS